MKAAVWGALSVPVCMPGNGTLREHPSCRTATPGTWGCTVGSGRAAQGQWASGRTVASAIGSGWAEGDAVEMWGQFEEGGDINEEEQGWA